MEPSGSEPALKASEMDVFVGKIVGCAPSLSIAVLPAHGEATDRTVLERVLS
jgi:hypothetical protein